MTSIEPFPDDTDWPSDFEGCLLTATSFTPTAPR
jgi:hypothetical protein